MSETLTETPAVSPEEVAAAQDMEQRNKELASLGSEASTIAKAVGRVLAEADDKLQSLARLALQARLQIVKRLQNGQFVHDWDGTSPDYRKWYDDFVLAVLGEQAPVTVFKTTRDDGTEEDHAIGDVDWVSRAKRTIQYYVAEYRGDFMREHGFENEASKFPKPLDLEKPSVKAARRYAERQRAAANPTPPTEQVASIVGDLEANRDNAVLVVDMLRSIAEQLDERLTMETVESLTKAQSTKLGKAVTAVNTILDGIIARMDEAEKKAAA